MKQKEMIQSCAKLAVKNYCSWVWLWIWVLITTLVGATVLGLLVFGGIELIYDLLH